MTQKQLMNSLYEIIAEHIEDLKYKNGVNLYLSEDNKLYVDLNDNKQMFVLEVREEK